MTTRNNPKLAKKEERASTPALICVSHLRWDFVFQRPQHLMTRFAAGREVYYFEEPIVTSEARVPCLRSKVDSSGVEILTPYINAGNSGASVLRRLIDGFLDAREIDSYCVWYYTPMALDWTFHLSPQAVIYDCMDELSAFLGAPTGIRDKEAELLRLADVVFTGGHSLFEAKSKQHRNIYSFPSSIDVGHFARARNGCKDPADQMAIPHVRIGYAGVIDERIDVDLLAGIADARPDWHLVLLGPVVKIPAETLPRRANIHYLGMKTYAQLPEYLSGWDAAILPFANNESTRFISPTKTPEYLAAGRPVVSAGIRDVINPYGEAGVVHIADGVADFVSAIERALAEDASKRIEKVNLLLRDSSWSRVFGRMSELIEDAVRRQTEKTGLTARLPQVAAAAQ